LILDEQPMYISKIIVHELYNSVDYDYDIAMMKLSSPITYTERVKPICLPSSGLYFSAGTQCFVTGWGKLGESGPFPKYLHEAKIPLVDQQHCKDTYSLNHNLYITDRMRCAGFDQGKIGSCQGDSGGPLACEKNKYMLFTGLEVRIEKYFSIRTDHTGK
jgi:secreted trypsin-like serine protease